MAACAILTPALFHMYVVDGSARCCYNPRLGAIEHSIYFIQFMKHNARLLLCPHCVATVLALLVLAACAPPVPSSPRPTAPVVLDITVAPTQDVDATATAYARQLVPTPTPAGLYVVQQGDTLGGLAEDFGTTVDELMAANGLTDANAIQAGQTLLIPSLISGTLALGTPAPLAGTSVPTATATLTPTATLATTAAPGRSTAPAKPTEAATPTLASP